jgi:hypothetical protein
MKPYCERVTWSPVEFLLCAICHRNDFALYHFGLTDEHFIAHQFVEPIEACDQSHTEPEVAA